MATQYLSKFPLNISCTHLTKTWAFNINHCVNVFICTNFSYFNPSPKTGSSLGRTGVQVTVTFLRNCLIVRDKLFMAPDVKEICDQNITLTRYS